MKILFMIGMPPVKPDVIGPFNIPGWKDVFNDEYECILQPFYYPLFNKVVFYPYKKSEQSLMSETSPVIFRVKRKLTNMMIADEIIANANKNEAI